MQRTKKKTNIFLDLNDAFLSSAIEACIRYVQS